jgi:divalent metal cation (Fe/Co/Zn/Cd) transporter
MIIGESMPREMRQLIPTILHKYSQVVHINRTQTMVMGDNKYLVFLSIDIEDSMTGYGAEDLIEQLKLNLKKEIPEIGTIYIEIQDSVRNQKI